MVKQNQIRIKITLELSKIRKIRFNYSKDEYLPFSNEKTDFKPPKYFFIILTKKCVL